MRAVWGYISDIIKRSTKRFIFIYMVVFVLTPLTYIYTNQENFEFVLAEMLTFLSLLAGGGIYERIKSNNQNSES
jgi:nitrate/nitrite transporter NarK